MKSTVNRGGGEEDYVPWRLQGDPAEIFPACKLPALPLYSSKPINRRSSVLWLMSVGTAMAQLSAIGVSCSIYNPRSMSFVAPLGDVHIPSSHVSCSGLDLRAEAFLTHQLRTILNERQDQRLEAHAVRPLVIGARR